MRGITETTRGAAEPDLRKQSYIVKRNATKEDLEQALAAYSGKPVKISTHPYARYTCVGVRLDQLNRLIFDLIREDQRQHKHTEGGNKPHGQPNE